MPASLRILRIFFLPVGLILASLGLFSLVGQFLGMVLGQGESLGAVGRALSLLAAVFLCALGLGAYLVATRLRTRRKDIWGAGLTCSAVMILTLFLLPVGLVGLVTLLQPGARRWFIVQ